MAQWQIIVDGKAKKLGTKEKKKPSEEELEKERKRVVEEELEKERRKKEVRKEVEEVLKEEVQEEVLKPLTPSQIAGKDIKEVECIQSGGAWNKEGEICLYEKKVKKKEKGEREESEAVRRVKALGKEEVWRKPDKLDYIGLFLILAFLITVFQNITYISSPLSYLVSFAQKNIVIVVMAGTGIAFKSWLDGMDEEKNGKPTGKTITKSVFDELTAGSVLETTLWFGLAFGIQILIGSFLLVIPLSLLQISNTQSITFSVISAISEELLFSLALLSILSAKFRYVSIPIVSGVFMIYHMVVYQAFAYLLYVLVMRVVYAIIYIGSRRWTSVALAHLLNNLLSSGMFGPSV